MTYIENVFVCMAAPLVVALLSLKRGQRAAVVFCLAGMGACLLSAYLNTFFARLYQADAVNAATQIAPVVEEIMKLPEKEKTAIYLHYYEGYSGAEIARLLKCRESTVFSYLHRGRKRLKKRLEEQL